MVQKHFIALLAGSASIAIAFTTAAGAQTVPPAAAPAADAGAAGSEEILVTARRRVETALSTPVIITALSGQQLQRAGVTSISDIAKLTPQLTVEQNVGSFGGSLTLRGVASPTSNTAAEPAVTVNIDGVPLSYGGVVRLGQFDLGQVEVLEGPQSLFFGKNSSGGIIAIKSAEPTDTLDSMLRVSYEGNARQVDQEGFVSGPITSTLKGRVAFKFSTSQGYFYNDAPGVANTKGPGTKEQGGRISLTYQPSSKLTVKFKGTFDHVNDYGTYFLTQRIYCPSGQPSGPGALPTVTDCTADSHMARGDLPSNVAEVSGDPLFRNGVPYSFVKQGLAVLDVNYEVAKGISLNSITGYYRLSQAYADSIIRGPVPILMASGSDQKRTWTEEARLSSDTPGSRLTWMVGGFYQNDHFHDTEHVVGFTPPTTLTPRKESFWFVGTKSWSVFGQASYNFTDTLSLSAGVRYTHETKTQSVNLSDKFIPSISFKNTSPEVTLAYKPNRNINIFASYKQGYKSGAFQISSLAFLSPIANPTVSSIDNSYKQETVKGFEGGVKASLFDHQLSAELVGYRYNYKNLQLSRFDPTISVSRISNAGASRVEGAEIKLSYSPRAVHGLNLFTSVAYNRARFTNFLGACYVGQTRAGGCDVFGPGAGANPNLQDESGLPLPRAPKIAGNVGFTYETTISDDLKVTVNSTGTFQSKAFLSPEDIPWGISEQRFLVDAGFAVGERSGSWELAFIGKNLANKRFGVSGFQESATGSGATTGTTAGIPSDYSAVVNRGRELWLRLTIKPNLF